MKRRRYRSQPRLAGVRRMPVGTAILSEIEDCIEAEMKLYKVSRSFVIATALAFVFGVDGQPRYDRAKVRPAQRMKETV